MAKFKKHYSNSITQIKRNMAKMLGLIHAAYNVWHDKDGVRYIWNNERNHFERFEGELK